jgi:hypothetical protein
LHDSFGAAVFDFIKSPLENYHKYRSLYKLEDIENSDEDDIAENIIWALRDVSFDVKQDGSDKRFCRNQGQGFQPFGSWDRLSSRAYRSREYIP